MAIKIIVCGDFRAENPEKIHFTEEVSSLFSGCDIRICNFEAPVKTRDAQPSIKSGPGLDQSEKSPGILKGFGFNVIQLANNHIMDYGEEGLNATLKAFEDVVTVGAGIAKEAFSARFVEIKGKRIGFLSFVHHEFGVVEYYDEDCCGAAWINSPDVPKIVIDAKKQCDFLMVLPHAGMEHVAAPLPEWRKIYKRFIDWGADCVIGGHPHCPQGWEYYKGKPIYYSIGDFYFDGLGYDDLWYKGILTEFDIEEEKVIVKEHFVCFDDNTGEISIDRSERMKSRIALVNNLLADSEAYHTYINKLCNSGYNGLKYVILRAVCGVSLKLPFKRVIRLLGLMLLGKKNDLFLLNSYQCETHRWFAERIFRNNNKIIKK